MKKYIISAFALFTLFTTSGCQDWLDVNHDPNVLEEIPDGKVLLPAAEVNLGNSLMGFWFCRRLLVGILDAEIYGFPVQVDLRIYGNQFQYRL